MGSGGSALFFSSSAGIRVNAFVAGGLLPATARGTKLGGLTTLWDFYATFAGLAGNPDPVDARAAAAGTAVDTHLLDAAAPLLLSCPRQGAAQPRAGCTLRPA